MSLYPFFVGVERPNQQYLFDQHFGSSLRLTPQDFLTMIAVPQSNSDYFRNWRNLHAATGDVDSTIRDSKDKFQVNLDVQHFAPEEISVKAANGWIVVEAKHEERHDDHGYISRSFTRRYSLPEGIEADNVTSKLSSDGVLTITAPLKAPPRVANERVVPIMQTGPVKKQVEGKEE